MQAAVIQNFERDPHVAPGTDCIWTSALVVGDEVIDMTVVGDPEDDGPSSFDVTGSRDGNAVTFASGETDCFEEACRQAIIAARRAAIRPVE